jgi:H+-translocating NAD(P) transhydrogenase subunit alpha
VLITGEMITGMSCGSVIVDIAAERGGNCDLTRAGETVVHQGISILGPLNLPSMVPYHASQMFATNVAAFLKLLVREGALNINLQDEIIRETLVTHDNKVVHPRISELLSASQGQEREVKV